MWRDQVAPYAEQIGIELPGQQVAEAPAEIPRAGSPAAPPLAAPSPAAPSTPAATTPSSEAAPAETPATDAEVERLTARQKPREQLAADLAISPRPEPAPPPDIRPTAVTDQNVPV